MADAGGNAGEQPAQQGGGGGGAGGAIMGLVRTVIMTMFISQAVQWAMGNKENALAPGAVTKATDVATQSDADRAMANDDRTRGCAWPPGTHVLGNITLHRDSHDGPLVAELASMRHVYSSEATPYHVNVTLNLTECAASNCSLFARARFHPTGAYRGLPDAVSSSALVLFRKRKALKLKNLFDDTPTGAADEVATADTDSTAVATTNNTATDDDTPIVAYLRTDVTLSLVADMGPLQLSKLPPTMRQHLANYDDTSYTPPAYHNDFWVLLEHRLEFNTSSAEMVNFTVTVEPIGMLKFALYTQMDQSLDMQEQWGLHAKDERDDLKRIFLDNNPYFLGLTICVSFVHLLFEYLAFSNDVSFWKNRKNLQGLSLRTVAVNCYFQLIVFLYLVDNETSWSVSVPSGIGVLIEFWKLRKCVRVEVDPETGRRSLHWNRASRDEATEDADRKATRILFFLGVPCLLGYSAYSALYDTHKGWYSFVIRTQVRFIYFTGFVMMTPQIFINYKLKSVAHMPWKTFVYKALNTFIDDLFAFIIKMPTMHRLACFRDDAVFLILLYQRYIYPVDMKRANEYGQVGDRDAAEAAAIEGTTEGGAQDGGAAAAEDGSTGKIKAE